MRYLSRPPLIPNCLGRYSYSIDTWRSVTKNGLPQVPAEADRNQIWEALRRMQKNVCAYCEGGLEAGSHIEHFAKRSSYCHLTFEWTNLFGSCNRTDCCGHYKDSQHNPHSHYSLQDLIKPDIENPWDILVFGSDGHVSVRDGISTEQRRKGQATIDVFNLDAPCHIPERISKYFLVRDVLLLIEDDSSDEVIALVVDEIRSILPSLETYSSAALQHLPSEILRQIGATI